MHHLRSYAVSYVPDSPPPYPTIREIQDAVCETFAIRRIDLLSHRRPNSLVVPRQAAMWLCRWLTPHPYTHIAGAFADRDHTTVAHGVSRTQQRMADDPDFAARIEALARAIGEDEGWSSG